MSTSTEIVMTSSEEIDAFVTGDNTIEITGYVDSVEGTKYVGKNSKALFKFILNNNQGRRLRVLLWEERAKTYESKIVNKEIVKIERGMYLPVNQAYYRKEENLIPFELSLSRNSVITFLGKHVSNEIEVHQVTATTIKECVNVEGKLSLLGFIKVTFTQITSTYSSYGSGAVVDGKYKLRVHISNFVENTKLIKGAQVKITGDIKKDKYDSIYLHVGNMQDIEIMDNDILSLQELNKGIYTPQKRRSGEMDNSPSPSKKSSNDCHETPSQISFQDDDLFSTPN